MSCLMKNTAEAGTLPQRNKIITEEGENIGGK